MSDKVKAIKALGQNFLHNKAITARIAESVPAGCNVLEIGPGTGALTAPLIERCKRVVCVEIDERMYPVLEEQFSHSDKFALVKGDIMALDLGAVISKHFGGEDFYVCANLPYYITTPIISMLLESKIPTLKAASVMVQKEAAARLCARTGTRECGAITYMVRYFSEPQKLFDVSRGNFTPAPNVDSSVVRFTLRPLDEMLSEDAERKLFALVKAAFSQRRKTFVNSAGTAFDKAAVAAALERLGIPAGERAEKLTLEDFVSISKEI